MAKAPKIKAEETPTEVHEEKKPLIVETAEVPHVDEQKDPEPIDEPSKATIDREHDEHIEAPDQAMLADPATAEIINAVLRKHPIRRAEAFVSQNGEKRVFVYAEDGVILRFIGHFEVGKN